MIIAKPRPYAGTDQPILLEDHIAAVVCRAEEILCSRPFLEIKYLRRTQRALRPSLLFCCRHHDDGKEHRHWQRCCLADFRNWVARQKQREPVEKHVAANLQSVGMRHEWESVRRLIQKGWPDVAAGNSQGVGKVELSAIAAHHGKLSHQYYEKAKSQVSDLPALWNSVVLDLGTKFRSQSTGKFPESIRQRYLFDGPRALLQFADHRASAAEAGSTPPVLEPFSYEFPYVDKEKKPLYNSVQELVQEFWDLPVALLRAPTGSGKTDAAFRWALRQIERGRADRLVMVMPTRFTANALSGSKRTAERQVGLYHSSAWHQYQQRAENSAEEVQALKAELVLARLLETPVTVTTLDHLCMCLTGTREDHHAIYFALAHSCVVFDETDFYDDFALANLRLLLEVLVHLEVPVLLMSATIPEAMRQILSSETLLPLFEDTADLERVRCHLQLTKPSSRPEDVASVLERALSGESLIIYANTVDRAQAYLDWFKQHNFTGVLLYHGRYTEPHKAAKEELLLNMLGRDAWTQKTAHGVAILTQIGELSVNISANVMLSDLCPVDRLAQRAGRLARFSPHSAGELFVTEPITPSGEFYPAPYGTPVRGSSNWEVAPAMEATRKWLQAGGYSAQSWVRGVQQVYGDKLKLSPEAENNVKELRKRFVEHWQILPLAKPNEEDGTVAEWKVRDIAPQVPVYVLAENELAEDLNFDNWRNFREWEQPRVISVAGGSAKMAVKNGLIFTRPIKVGEDSLQIRVAKPEAYSFERGLRLRAPDEEG